MENKIKKIKKKKKKGWQVTDLVLLVYVNTL